MMKTLNVRLGAAIIAVLCTASFLALRGSWSESPARASILCFGDSISEGYWGHNTKEGVRFHPYSKRLTQVLTQRLPPASHIEVAQQGLSGELVTRPSAGGPGMVPRLAEALAKAEASGQRYTWVLLLAGINDVSSGVQVDAIHRGILDMWNQSLVHGARVLAMTPMEAPYSIPAHQDEPGSKEFEAARQQLNERLRAAAVLPGFKRGVVLLDLDKTFTQTKLTPEEHKRLWDDDLHPTPDGYDAMGTMIASALLPHLRPRRTLGLWRRLML